MSQFSQDVFTGLTSNPKYLSSKYFYDENGDELFRRIMGLDEYYLTRAEFSIFKDKKSEILTNLSAGDPFRLIELGAGDGAKTMVLLEHFMKNRVDFTYCPVDISENVLNILESSVRSKLPDISMEPLAGDYFQMLHQVKMENHRKNVVFFLGSNLGNYPFDLALSFLSEVRNNLNRKDLLMIGLDLKKDPEVILNAYNDKEGVTAAFNLNLLQRINRELDGDFDLTKFRHYPTYDPVLGECTSYLISLTDQSVNVGKLGLTVDFSCWEPMKMEISRKYSLKEIRELSEASGFKMIKNLLDKDQFFVESIWEAI